MRVVINLLKVALNIHGLTGISLVVATPLGIIAVLSTIEFLETKMGWIINFITSPIFALPVLGGGFVLGIALIRFAHNKERQKRIFSEGTNEEMEKVLRDWSLKAGHKIGDAQTTETFFGFSFRTFRTESCMLEDSVSVKVLSGYML